MLISIDYGHEGTIGTYSLSGIDDEFFVRLGMAFRRVGIVLVRQVKLNLSGPGRKQFNWISKRQKKLFEKRAPFSRLHNYPGVVSGGLRRSVKFKITGRRQFLTLVVGPNKIYAAVHEFGAEIPVTPKMRGFLHSLGIHLKKATSVIRIPARAYTWPAYERHASRIAEIIEKELITP